MKQSNKLQYIEKVATGHVLALSQLQILTAYYSNVVLSVRTICTLLPQLAVVQSLQRSPVYCLLIIVANFPEYNIPQLGHNGR